MNKEKQSGDCKNCNSHEKQQIEEMARVLRPLTLCSNCLSSLSRDKKRDGGCYKPIGYECSLDRDILKYCESLYNTGYRKQSDKGSSKGCEYCKGRAYTKKPLTVITKYGRRIELVFEFCPNCGRKMKGGAE